MSIGTGTRLGQYEVQDLIGQGAMGVVYRAYHVQLERTGAVKVLQGISPDGDSTARFRHEAQAIAQMRHPNILNVFDFGEYEGTPYMIIEYVPGGSLAGQMKQGPMEIAAVLRFLRGIASGLDYAHSLGIVHRDVKPANVLLEKDGTPVIADFGLVKLMQSTSLRSMTGVTTGTPAYMAPEQVTGSHAGPAADRYSLATIAYEMLTGVIPFDGEGLMEILYKHVHGEPPLPSARNASLGPQVDAVIMRGLAKEPAARWETCTEFVDALEAALADTAQPVGARTMVMSKPVVSTTVPFAWPAVPAGATSAARADAVNPSATVAVAYPAAAAPVAKRRSHKRLIALIAAAVIVALLIFVVGAWAVAHQPTTLALSSNTVFPGESIVVSATHLPANQAGEFQLWSALHTFPFKASASGAVATVITIPSNVGIGDHLVKVCWNGGCHAQTTLHVVARVASTTPLANVTPSVGGNPSPNPTSTPGSPPQSTPSANPTHAASPIPTPPASPRPSPTPATPMISISNYNIKLLTGTETVYGLHFASGSTVTITFIQGSTTNKQVGTQTVSSSGYFSHFFTVPATAVLGPASIKVCGTAGCLFATVNVNLTG